MNAAAKAHIQTIGPDKFDTAFGNAMVVIRQDRRFVGLDKTRNAIAEEAALRATGFEKRPLILPRGIGTPTQAFQDACEEVLEVATWAAEAEK